VRNVLGALEDPSDGALAQAIEWNLFGLNAALAGIPRARVDHNPRMMRVRTGLRHELMNGIFRAQLPLDGIDASIRDALEDFRSRELPMIWWTGPSTEPPELGKYLEHAGLVHAGDLTGTAVDLDSLPESVPTPDDLTIEAVRDERTLRTWIAPVAFGYEFPQAAALALFNLFDGFGFDPDAPFQHYLGRWKGHPISTCSMFYGAGVAGMHTTVVPAYRGLGIGAAMTLASMLDARALGYRIGVANASANGSRVQGSLGFKPYCRLGLYMPTQWGGLEATDAGVPGDGIAQRPWVHSRGGSR